MKKLLLLKILFYSIFFDRIRGSSDVSINTPVMAGLDAILKYNGKVVGYATNVSSDEDMELQGIRTLGYHGDRDFKSVGYNCTVSVGTFVLMGSVYDALPTPTRRTILQSGLIDFELLDLNEGTTLFILHGCKCATIGINFDSTALATKTTTWRCREVIPKSVS